MSELSDPSIAAALGPVPDGEMKIAASAMLGSLLAENSSESARMEERGQIQWPAPGQMKKRRLWRFVIGSLATISVLLSVAIHFKDALFYQRIGGLGLFGWDNLLPHAEREMEKATWTEEDRLLLFGDRSRSDADKRKTLWERHPENPAYFSDHVNRYFRITNNLPPGLREDAARIDPDNAYFRYVESAVMLKKAVKSRSLSKAEKIAGVPPFTVVDQAGLDQALEIAERAGGQPFFSSHRAGLIERREQLLDGGSRRKVAYRSLLIHDESGPEMIFRQIDHGYLMKAHQLASAGDRIAFLKLLGSAESYLKHLSLNRDPSLLSSILLASTISSLSEAFGNAADQLGLTAEATRMRELNQRIKNYSDGQKSRREERSKFEGRGDFLGGTIAILERFSKDPLPLTVNDLIPGSRADHALAWRAFALGAGFLGGLFAILTAGVRFIVPPPLRMLGNRFEVLLGFRDYLRIIGFGLLIPTVYIFGISELTSLGGRDWSVGRTWPLLPTAHAAAWLILMLGCSLIAARDRLAVRSERFSLGKPSWLSRFGVPAMIITAISVPITGMFVGIGAPSESESLWMGIFLLPACFWLIALSCAAPFGSLDKRLTAVSVGRVMTVVLGCATILMMALGVVFHWEDDFWYSRYKLAGDGIDEVNYRTLDRWVGDRMRGEMAEILSDGR